MTSAFGERWVYRNIQRKQYLGNAADICEAFVPFTNRQKTPVFSSLNTGLVASPSAVMTLVVQQRGAEGSTGDTYEQTLYKGEARWFCVTPKGVVPLKNRLPTPIG